MLRYLSLIWEPSDIRCAEQVAVVRSALLAEDALWKTAYRSAGVLVMHHLTPQQAPCVHVLASSLGVILGSLFRRSREPTPQPRSFALDAAESQRVFDSGGRHLVERYWGSYVAIINDATTNSCSILRDPTANMACFHAIWDDIHVLFSHATDFRRHIPMAVSANWPHIATHLITGGQLSRECGLREIEDIPGGESVTFSSGEQKRATLWHPGQFCVEKELEDHRSAARELRSAVLGAVHALASDHPNILVRLSGGLDSSIVTSCLAQDTSDRKVTCLNFYVSTTPDEVANARLTPGLSKENVAKVRRMIGGADEREFARSVAEKCKFQLVEREKRVRDLDVREISHAPLAPRPSYFIFVLDEDRAETECATEVGATACFTGEGGDTVFYNTLRVIGALDYAYLHPLGRHLPRHIGTTAALSGESIARVIMKVIKHGYLHLELRPPMDVMRLPHLLRDEAAASVASGRLPNAWVDAAPPLCPGKRNHVLGVALSLPTYHRAYHRERVAVSLHPLSSQPVVEACLRIPTYVLLADGLPRGLARQAFGDLLPPKVLRRTSKGVPVSWCQQLVRRNLGYFKDCLLDGLLVKERILDRAKLEAYLTEDQPFLTVQPQQLMGYLACEAWLSQWTGR